MTDPKPQHIALGEQTSAPSTVMAQIESSRAVQEVQASLIIAKRFPRNEEEALQKIVAACQRPSLADAGLYTFARGGSEISGPSIRLAETIKRLWGNIDSGWRELDRRGNESTVQAFAWDKETNVREVRDFVVRHVRNTKNGSYPLKDERDIYENMANQSARRVRACILAIIPEDVKEAAVSQCEETMAGIATPDVLDKMEKAFLEFGVNRAMIEARIQRKLEAITGSQVADLKKVYASLRDGIGKTSEHFDIKLADAKPEAEVVKTNMDKFKEKQGMQTGEHDYANGDPEPSENPKQQ